MAFDPWSPTPDLDHDDDHEDARRAKRGTPGRRTLTMAIQRRAAAGSKSPNLPSGARELDLGGGGAPLPGDLRASMERSFAADFGGVRVHHGGAAAALGAEAFALGNDLHFAAGRFDPSSDAGRSLIGHELAHVVQQREGRVSAGGQGKGLAINDDGGLEAEADAWGAAAARGEIVRTGSLLGGESRGPVQRKPTAVGIVKDVATSSMTRDVLVSLIKEHALEHVFETVERVAFFYMDPGLTGVLGRIGDIVMTEGLKAALALVGNVFNPILGALTTLRSILHLLPQVVQTIISYGLGRGMAAALGYLVSTPTAEGMVNAVFVDGSLVAAIEWVRATIDDLLHRPASWLYKQVWNRFRPSTTQAPTPGAYAAEQLSGSPSPAPSEERSAQQVAQPLVKKDFKHVWLEVDQPALARFDHKEKKSGGLQLPFKLGLNLFDTKLETKSPQMINLPWSGGFTIALSDLEVTNPPGLPPVFTIGGIVLPSIVVNDQGLEAFTCEISTVSLADGAVKLPKVSAEWKKNKGLKFKGSLETTILDTPLRGAGELVLADGGAFEEATIGIESPATFSIVPDIIVMKDPGFRGRVTKGGEIDLSLWSSMSSAFSIFELAFTRAHVDYKKGKGHEFSGGVDKLHVGIGKHVSLDAVGLELDRHGMRVKEASLLYTHDPEKPDQAKGELDSIGGIDPSVLSFTGLKQLVVGGKVHGLRIGAPPKPLAVESASIEKPPVEKPSADDAEKPKSPDDRFHVDRVSPVLSKIGANLFGVEAVLDIENKQGSIKGAIDYQPPIPDFQASFPLVPGLEVFAGLGADVKLGADVGASLAMPEQDRFHLSGSVGASATLGVEFKGGVNLGSAYAAALGVGLFARAEAAAKARTTIGGVIVLDREAKRLRASEVASEKPKITYAADAELSASVGVVVQATALVFFKKELWRYTFKKWTFGKYEVAGEVGSKPDGGADLMKPSHADFEGGKPQAPTIDHQKLEDARAELMKPQKILGSAEERKTYLDELVKRYKEADEPVARQLDRVAHEHASMRQDYFAQNIELAQRGSVTTEEIQERMRKREEVEAVEARYNKAKSEYREVQLVLVDAASAAASSLENGEINIADIEARIRRAADEADAAKRAKDQVGQ
ncbi:MAG TPA: DUF4157 domain-containing protein [Kofleriaceae bacterium]|nr:DUF4157 domain-containing protein [Kofleriaceae bacterium]